MTGLTLPKKARVVIDIDDVFLPLNEHAAAIAGVDYKDIVTFYSKDNPILSPEAADRLYRAYQTPRIHAGMQPYPGADKFGDLAEDPRVDPWICSNSLDQDVIDDKDRSMRLLLGDRWDLFHKMLNLIKMEHSKTKKFPPDIWMLIDDSPLNAVASGSKHVLMPERPWNLSEWGRGVLRPIERRVVRYSCIEEAYGITMELLDKEFGPLPET